MRVHAAFSADFDLAVRSDVRIIVEQLTGGLHADSVDHDIALADGFGAAEKLGAGIGTDAGYELLELRVGDKIGPRDFDNQAIVVGRGFVGGGARNGADLNVVVAVVGFGGDEVEPTGGGE